MSNIKIAKITRVCETKVWIEGDILGSKHVMVQHEGHDPTTYCTFFYDHRYTNNGMIHKAAERVAISIGAKEPVLYERREIEFAPELIESTESHVSQKEKEGKEDGPR